VIRGFYTAASGMLSSVRRMEAVVNNLANVQTTGFKQERTTAASFGEQVVLQLGTQLGSVPLGPLVLSIVAQAPELDLGQGPLQATGRASDIALEGPGFLVVETARGLVYTRDGSLTRDAQGFLITNSGGRVIGENGPIQLPDGPIAIRADGTVFVADVPVDRLQVVEFAPDQSFERLGNNELVPRGPAVPGTAAATAVHQGFIEGSNVDLTGTITTMLELQRAYEANQRMIQYQDQLLMRAVNDVARPTS